MSDPTPGPDWRVDPGFLLPERAMLEAWLDFHRATLRWKLEGLTDEQVKERSVPPSSLSLLGLVRHMAEVERNWFRRVLDSQDANGIFYDGTNPDGDFDSVDDAVVADDLATYEAEVAAARDIAAAKGLDDTGTRRGQPCSVRWIYVHMIEEYARHNGHADLLRERIDGQIGD
ncbi:MAG: DinB family protein [Acidimicrobiales bacterium]